MNGLIKLIRRTEHIEPDQTIGEGFLLFHQGMNFWNMFLFSASVFERHFFGATATMQGGSPSKINVGLAAQGLAQL